MLDKLLALDFISQVVINTDAHQELTEAGLPDSDKYIIKDRPAHLLGDDVSMNLILADDISSHPADVYLMTHTTNPLLAESTLQDAYANYVIALQQGKDSLFSVNRFHSRFYTEAAEPINHDPANLTPTQDLPPWFEENSCYYFFTADSFSRTNARIGERPVMHETPALENIDIDEWKDWQLADAVIHMQQSNL